MGGEVIEKRLKGICKGWEEEREMVREREKIHEIGDGRRGKG